MRSALYDLSIDINLFILIVRHFGRDDDLISIGE